MRRRLAWLLASAVAIALNVMPTETTAQERMAPERPTQEHIDIMKSNAAIVAPTSLAAHSTDKNYDALIKDAATLKANFEKIEAFWARKKADDAIALAKAGAKAASDLETAAKAKDDTKILVASRAFGSLCEGCHQTHRVFIPSESRYEIYPENLHKIPPAR